MDAIQAVDLCYDAMMSEIDNGKMRVFLSDVMFDVERDGKGGRVSIPFGKGDCTVFRKVMSTEDTIQEFAPALRTEAQARAFRVALQTLGDLCGFGINYFDLENVGYVKTATEVSADNSALMRNIRRHEHALEGAIAGICRALLAVERRIGVGLPRRGRDQGDVRRQHHHGHDGREAAGTWTRVAAGLMEPWEYRAKMARRGRGRCEARRGVWRVRCEPRRFGWRQRSPGRGAGARAPPRGAGDGRAGADEMMSRGEGRGRSGGRGGADEAPVGADGCPSRGRMIAAPVRTAAAIPAHAPRLPGWAAGIRLPVGQAPRPRQGLRGALARHGVARDGVRLARGRCGHRCLWATRSRPRGGRASA